MHLPIYTFRSPLFSSPSKIAGFAVAVVVVTWSFSSIGIKFVSTTGLVASFYRLWIAIPFLWALVLSIPSLRIRLNRDWLYASLIGGTLFGFHQIAFFTSLKLTSIANVVIIAALQPVLVLLIAKKLFHEKGNPKDAMWSFIALAGTAIEMIGSTEMPARNLMGDIIAIVNLLFFTGYFLFSKSIRKRVGVLEYLVGMCTMGGIIVGIANLITQQDLVLRDSTDLFILFIIAVVPGTLGHLIVNWAHLYTKAFIVSMMLLAIPVISASGAAFFLNEKLNLIQITGGLVVLLSIGMVIRNAK